MAESEELFTTQDENFDNNYTTEPVNMQNTQNLTENDNQTENMDSEPVTAEKNAIKKITEFPLTRIRSIMKMDPDVTIASQEAVYLIAKATELFLASISKETYRYTFKAKRKTVQRRDIDAAIENLDTLCFLEGALD